MKKSVYSLGPLGDRAGRNRRYLAFPETLDDPRAGLDKLHRVSEKVREGGRGYRGFNFFDEEDAQGLEAICTRRILSARDAEQDVAAPAEGTHERTGLRDPQAVAATWSGEEGPQRLSVLSDGSRADGWWRQAWA